MRVPHNKLTQSQFMSRSILIHNGFYDYSKVNYINGRTKVCIICPEHGEFWQPPESHLKGHGCRKCGRLEAVASKRGFHRHEKGDILHESGYSLIPLGGGDYAKVDSKDLDSVRLYNWCVKNSGNTKYAVSTIDGRRVRMHRLIMSPKDGELIDHINHDGLDNRRSNLRKVSPQENIFNSRPQKGHSSAYKGVSWSKQHSKWEAYITKDKKRKHLGLFDSEDGAARAYDNAASSLFGVHACLNFKESK